MYCLYNNTACVRVADDDVEGRRGVQFYVILSITGIALNISYSMSMLVLNLASIYLFEIVQ